MTSNGGLGLEAISSECARIGFDMRELGGLAFSGKDALASFLALLREIPSGVGLEAFLQRMRSRGIDLSSAEDELRELDRS